MPLFTVATALPIFLGYNPGNRRAYRILVGDKPAAVSANGTAYIVHRLGGTPFPIVAALVLSGRSAYDTAFRQWKSVFLIEFTVLSRDGEFCPAVSTRYSSALIHLDSLCLVYPFIISDVPEKNGAVRTDGSRHVQPMNYLLFEKQSLQ